MSNCLTLTPALSSLSIGLQSDCTMISDSALLKSIYTKEKVFIKPELDTIENEPASSSGNAKDTVFIDTFLRSTTEISVPLQNFSSIAEFKNSHIHPLLSISYLNEVVLLDSDKIKALEYGAGEVIEVTFKTNGAGIDGLTAIDGDLAFNLETLKLQIREAGAFRDINNQDPLNLLELQQLCRHYVNANVGNAPTFNATSKLWEQTGVAKFNADGDILHIDYSDSEPVGSLGSFWVDTSTNARVTKVHDGTSFVDSTYVVGISFTPSTTPTNVATVIAKEEDVKYSLKSASAKVGFSFEPSSYINLKFTLNAEMKEEEGIYELDTPPEVNEFAIMGADGDIKLTDKDNTTLNANYFDCDMVEFDMTNEMEHVPMFSPNSGFISFKYKPTLKLGGYKNTKFSTSVSELVANNLKGFKFSVRDAVSAVAWKFNSNRIKNSDKADKSDKKGAKYITKTLQCKDTTKDDSFSFEFHESV